jgi:Phosphatidylinositol-specific phospholipase C, X domain
MTQFVQLFYRGSDNALWTRWRTPDPNGSWADETGMGGVLNGKPFCAAIPGTNVMQLFYRGSDNSLYTRWRNPDGSWSGETGMGGVLNGDPIAAAIPGTNVLQVFYQGSDNSLYTRWRDATGNWSNEVGMGGILAGEPTAAAVPGANVLQVFYRGLDNSLHSNWRTAGPNGYWTGDANMGGVINGDPIASPIPSSNVLQVFYVGAGNGLYTNWRNTDGSWSGEVAMGGSLTTDPMAALSPPPWMSQLPDSAMLSRLTLPGTHDTCTAGLIPLASSQSLSLADQLNHGIRYIDIRCKQVDSLIEIYHGPISTGLGFDNVTSDCVNFLAANPTECIVMQIKQGEDPDVNPTGTFQQVLDTNYVQTELIVQGVLQNISGFFYFDDRIPTLGEVRGKIVVVRRFDLDGSDPRGLTAKPWADNATFNVGVFAIQDQYNLAGSDDASMQYKWNAVDYLLGSRLTDASDTWYINFLSASSSIGDFAPYTAAAYMNPQLYDALSGGGPYPNGAGTLMMDFPDDNTIGMLISINMPV